MENGNVVVEPKKKTPIGLIILIVILMIGCLIGGYFLNDSGIFGGKTDTDEPEIVEEKEEEVAIDSDIVKKLDRNITTAGAPYYGGFYELFTDKRMTANDLSDDAKGKVMVLRLYDKTSAESFTKWEGTTYTKAEVDELAKAVFGSDVSFKHMNFGSCPTIYYDATSETYKVGGSACGGTTGPYHERHKVMSAVKKGKLLTLSIRIVFGDGSKFYSDYAKTKVIQEDKDQYGNPTITDFSNGSLYNAVFKLENGNYALSYVEPVKD